MSAAHPPIPLGFGITLDPSMRLSAGGVVSGGTPIRALRLTDAGRQALADLRRHPVTSATHGLLARRLVEAGLAHPVPPATPADSGADVTVLVPVLDRPGELDRCLTALGSACPVVVVDDGSADGGAVARIAQLHGARLVRLPRTQGPGAARNRGLREVDTEFVAFLDSDCVPPAGWVAALRPYLADPLVAAVAPRIVGRADRSWRGRYSVARGALDLGAAPALVRAGGRVAYVPTAALVARRSALTQVAGGPDVFDPFLRYGEDVDLVWRLDAAGWRVLYVPQVQVGHVEPVTWPALLARRFRYGTSAGPLARRHPDRTASLVLTPGPTLTLAALAAGRPAAAAVAFGATAVVARRHRRAAGVSGGAVAAAVRGTWATGLGVSRWSVQFGAPVLAAAAAVSPRPRLRTGARTALLGASLAAWWPRRDALDPVRFVLADLADQIAYGTGVWVGAWRSRSPAAVRPRLVVRPVPARAAAPARRPRQREGVLR